MDAFLRRYFREHKAVGSKDRQEICETLYGMIRLRGLVDAHSSRPISWKKRLESYLTLSSKDSSRLPLHVQVSFPKFLFEGLAKAYGEKKAVEFCKNSNEQAPTTIRINPLKTSRAALLKKWDGLYEVSPCEESPLAITFNKRINFFALPEFKAGFFEIQDEGSQMIANHVNAAPGDHILDYCAGSGG